MAELTIEHVSPSALTGAAYNPRTMPAEARKRLARSIREFGFVDPVIARRSDGLVIGGHQRLVAAQELGLATVPVIFLDDIDDQRAAALNIALNNPAEQGMWDMPKLAGILSTLDAEGFDATLTGFELDEIERLLAPVAGGLLPGADEDSVPDPPPTPVTQLGDTITLGSHRLVCGDATTEQAWAAVLDGESPGAMWTDPPYGVNYGEKNAMLNRTRGVGSRAGSNRIETPIINDGGSKDDLRTLLRSALSLAWTKCRDGAVWYVAAPAGPLHLEFREHGHELQVWRQTLAWVKTTGFVLGRSDYHYRHEPILYGWKEGAAHTWHGGRSQDTVMEVPRPRANKLHPTMKPVALIQRCIENSTDQKELVCDPFAGSGSTLIACEASNRRARLIELSPAYCDVIVSRWEEATGMTAERTAERHARS